MRCTKWSVCPLLEREHGKAIQKRLCWIYPLKHILLFYCNILSLHLLCQGRKIKKRSIDFILHVLFDSCWIYVWDFNHLCRFGLVPDLFGSSSFERAGRWFVPYKTNQTQVIEGLLPFFYRCRSVSILHINRIFVGVLDCELYRFRICCAVFY